MSHVAHMNESRRKYERVTSHIYLCDTVQQALQHTHINEIFRPRHKKSLYIHQTRVFFCLEQKIGLLVMPILHPKEPYVPCQKKPLIFLKRGPILHPKEPCSPSQQKNATANQKAIKQNTLLCEGSHSPVRAHTALNRAHIGLTQPYLKCYKAKHFAV